MLSNKLLSGTSPYLEDILHPPEVSDGDHDGWGHLKMDFASSFQKYIILGVLSDKLLSGTSPYLEDVLHPPEVPDGDHDGWSHLHWTGFCLRFAKIYDTWDV